MNTVRQLAHNRQGFPDFHSQPPRAILCAERPGICDA
jgi:hypothetical protein